MHKAKILTAIIFLSLILSVRIYSQPKFERTKITIIKEEFALILDSLIKPPLNCDEAWNLMTYDSLKNNFIYIPVLLKQDERIQKLSQEIINNLNKNKPDIPQVPSGNGPPQGGLPPGEMGPPGGMNFPDESQEIIEDMEYIIKSMDKISVLQEKFKNQLTALQFKVNEKLHKTLENDYDEHINIINDFMKSVLTMYEQYYPVFKENMKKIDEVVKKYDYGSKIKFPPLKNDIINVQSVQVDNLIFLLNITKEIASAGAKFYNEKQMSMK